MPNGILIVTYVEKSTFSSSLGQMEGIPKRELGMLVCFGDSGVPGAFDHVG